MSTRRMVIVVDGCREWRSAKTGMNLLRYCPEQCVAVYDRAAGPATAAERCGLGGAIPAIADLADAPAGANTLVLGTAPAGGRLPESWRAVILAALGCGMDILSGLHDFLCDDAEFAAAAAASGARLIDVRRNRFRQVATREGLDERCLRIHTVGQDCNVGKMLVSVELTAALKAGGVDAKFCATGQTGIMIAGDGVPIDCVVADFVNGAAEQLVRDHQHHEALLIEGQGCILHPRYSAVTLGLLHGCVPDALILCYEVGRTCYSGMEIELPPLEAFVSLNEQLASAQHPCKVIGVAMNSSRVSAAEAEAEREKVRRRLSLPVADVVRHGSDELVGAILDHRRAIGK